MNDRSEKSLYIAGKDAIVPAFSGAVSVFWGCDNNFLPCTATAVASIIAHSAPDRHYDLLIFTEDVTPENRAAMLEWTGRYPHISLRFVDVSDLVKAFGIDRMRTTSYWSRATYYRLLALQTLKQYDKIIYLDGDVVCLTDIAELFALDLEGCAIGGVRDGIHVSRSLEDERHAAYWRDLLEKEPGSFYFNAGVLLLDLPLCRERDAFPKVIDKLLSSKGKLRFGDQDALNWAFTDSAKELPKEWNTYDYEYAPRGSNDTVAPDVSSGVQKISILHFTGIKPWRWKYLGNNYAAYWTYAAQTPFYRKTFTTLKKECTRSAFWTERLKLDLQYIENTAKLFIASGEKKEKYLRKIQRIRFKKGQLHRQANRIWATRPDEATTP